jgi:2,3-dihydroxybiphenyl 1,2-dioxygenase
VLSKFAVTELGYIGIGVKDMTAWRTFASEIMGLEWAEEKGEEDRAYLRMDYWHHRFIVHRDGSDDLQYAGFRAAGPEELAQIGRQLKDLGHQVETGSEKLCDERRVLGLIRTVDPGGVPVEVFHGPEVDGWRPMRPGRGMHARFRTGGGGLGHLVIRDRGVEESARFYREGLGMQGYVEAKVKLPDGSVQQPTFLHCNERDHTLGIGAGVMNPVHSRIHHVMVEVESIDDVGLAYDLVQQHKVPVLMTPGKHSNDEMFSFYVQTPSGWFWEYGNAGRQPTMQTEYCTRDSWGHALVGMHLLAGR